MGVGPTLHADCPTPTPAPPLKGEGGDASCLPDGEERSVRGAAPSTMLRMVPLPRHAGEGPDCAMGGGAPTAGYSSEASSSSSSSSAAALNVAA